MRLRIVDTTELVNSTALLKDLNDHSEFLEHDDADELKEQSKKAAQTKNTSEGFKQKWRLAASISFVGFACRLQVRYVRVVHTFCTCYHCTILSVVRTHTDHTRFPLRLAHSLGWAFPRVRLQGGGLGFRDLVFERGDSEGRVEKPDSR